MKLDYSLKTPEERLSCVNAFLEENPNPSPQYLEILADYLVFCMDKEEKKQHKILTENRLATLNKRETSLDELEREVPFAEPDKNVIFTPKVRITEQDLNEIPFLRQVREAISLWESILKNASGRDSYIAKQAIIDLRKEQYLIKEAYRKPVQALQSAHSPYAPAFPHSETYLPEEGRALGIGASLLSPKVCAAILRDYTALKTASEGAFHTELWALMFDFDSLLEQALRDYPLLRLIVDYKIAGESNGAIQIALADTFGATHKAEYISKLWRRRIPALIADQAQENFLSWYFLDQERGSYKRCRRCGQVKLALPRYFSSNSASKDGFYSVCKKCRSKKYLDKIV